MQTLIVIDAEGKSHEVSVDRFPEWCPRCQKYSDIKVIAAVQGGSTWHARRDALAVCECGEPGCGITFVCAYALVAERGIETALLMSHKPLEYVEVARFSESLVTLSKTFCETYDESVRAQENGLTQICGAGFRRALEFLCKDYAIFRLGPAPDDQRQRIARMQLGQCIKDFLPQQIQQAAARAAWLGNDETHYYRVWTDRDVNDLRALIDLTAKSIDFSLELDRHLQAMPTPRG